MALTVGTTAPTFKLFNTDKKEVSLGDYQGKKVILHFFPAAFTGVCTQQMCTSRDNMDYYHDLGAEVIGISVDSPFALGAFKKTNEINFELLSDFNKATIRDYDVYFENFVCNMKGVAARAAFVIDAQGVIRYSEQTPSPGDLPNFEAIKAAIAAC